MTDPTPSPDVRHLWEVDHPYYCGEATWYRRSDGGFDHQRWESWADFRDNTIFVTGDRDLNLLFRWDWHSWRRMPEPEDRSEEPDELLLYFVLQRKPILCSHYVAVTDADEPEIRAWLEECARTVSAMWEPITAAAIEDNDPVPVQLEPGESEGPDIATSSTEQPAPPHQGPAPYLPEVAPRPYRCEGCGKTSRIARHEPGCPVAAAFDQRQGGES